MTDTNHILRIDASARLEGSLTRSMANEMIEHLSSLNPTDVVVRDVAEGLPFVDKEWVAANFTPADKRTPAQVEKLALSDSLIAEVKAADILVFALPVYNFGIPATLKAWIDMVARAGLTFRYTEKGPVGLLEGKRAIILFVSGGTPVGSGIDFASTYLRHILGFIGIHDVDVIAADAIAQGAEEKLVEASASIRKLT